MSESESVTMNYFYYFNYSYYNYNNWFQGRNERWLKIGMGLCGLCLVGYIVGPPLYYHLSESLSTTTAAVSTAPVCRPCFCDCSSQPLLSLHEGWSNKTLTNCMKHEPGKSEEMDTDLLSEELKLREAEAQENQRRVDRTLLEAKKRSSQYQKEADKCNMGMETCEGTREKAEATLAAQKKITAMWELRARKQGWTETPIKLPRESPSNLRQEPPIKLLQEPPPNLGHKPPIKLHQEPPIKLRQEPPIKLCGHD